MVFEKNRVLREDIENIVDECKSLKALSGYSVLVTGATGLIGSQVIKAFLASNIIKGTNIKVFALVRNEKKAKDIFGDFIARADFSLVIGDISLPLDLPNVDYIVHGASPTSSKFFVTNPVETIYTAINGAKNILEVAKASKSKGVVFLSSLEVYGIPNTEGGVVAETDFGYIDCMNVRSSYSEGKRMVECLCASYASEYGVPVKVLRLSQTFGAGVKYDDGRVFAEFARCAIEKKNIVLHTKGNTVRTYCYTSDAVNAIITALVEGKAGEAYNISNPATDISISDMAKLVCDAFPESGICVEYDLPDDIESFGYNPEMIIRLDTSKIEELGWLPKYDLKDMFSRMIESFEC